MTAISIRQRLERPYHSFRLRRRKSTREVRGLPAVRASHRAALALFAAIAWSNIASGQVHSGIPEPDVVVWGTLTVNGRTVEDGHLIAKWPNGSVEAEFHASASGPLYALRVPVDRRLPGLPSGRPGTAAFGDTLELQFNGRTLPTTQPLRIRSVGGYFQRIDLSGAAPLYELGVAGPDLVQVDDSAEFSIYVSHEGEGLGANAWSFGLQASNLQLRSGTFRDTFEGTDALELASAGRSFLFAENIRVGEDEALLSAAILDFQDSSVTLPARARSTVLKFRVVGIVGADSGRMEFRDGLVGSGEPVETVVVGVEQTEGAPTTTKTRPIRRGMTVRISNGTGFIRGNVDSRGDTNITDGVFLLTYLFLGGREPPCHDAADADDSGRLALTDAIWIFNWLFLQGGPPASPYPQCGEDPSEDLLTCSNPQC